MSKIEKDIKRILKFSKNDRFIQDVLPEKKRIAIINDIKEKLNDELIIRKLMRNEVFTVTSYIMECDILNIRFGSSNSIHMLDESTENSFKNEFIDFIYYFMTNIVSQPVLNIASTYRGNHNWKLEPLISVAIPREGNDTISLFKTFTKMQQFQDTFQVTMDFNIGAIRDINDGESIYKYNGTIDGWSLTRFSVSDDVIMITFSDCIEHISKTAIDMPDDVAASDYFNSKVEKFIKDNKIKSDKAKAIDNVKAIPEKTKSK